MPWKHKDGRTIQEGTAWDRHPYNWASSWSDADKKRLGLTWEKEVDTSFDNRFYWSKDVEKKLDDEDVKDKDGKQLYEADGKTKIVNEGLKKIWIKQTKATANGLLSNTDWLVTRKVEKDIAIPSTITTYRDSVRTKCAEIETKINACKKLADFIKLFDEPVDSNGNVTGDNPPIYDFPKEI